MDVDECDAGCVVKSTSAARIVGALLPQLDSHKSFVVSVLVLHNARLYLRLHLLSRGTRARGATVPTCCSTCRSEVRRASYATQPSLSFQQPQRHHGPGARPEHASCIANARTPEPRFPS